MSCPIYMDQYTGMMRRLSLYFVYVDSTIETTLGTFVLHEIKTFVDKSIYFIKKPKITYNSRPLGFN